MAQIRSGRLMTLRVRGQKIETTHEHPWWVVGKGWVTANNLAAGDVFVTSEHTEVVLESVEDADRYVAVYNLEVEADHTYFVGDVAWGFDVWSHNHTEGASPVLESVLNARGVYVPNPSHPTNLLARSNQSWALANRFRQAPTDTTSRTVRNIIAELGREGWTLVNTNGSHRQFRHPTQPGRVTVSGQLGGVTPQGTMNSIWRQAGWL